MIATTGGDHAIPDVTCPGCGGLHWIHDGFGVHADGPRIDLGRFAGSDRPDEPWHCGQCGHGLDDPSVEAALTQLQESHWE